MICVNGVVANCDFTRIRVESEECTLTRENPPSGKMSEKTFRPMLTYADAAHRFTVDGAPVEAESDVNILRCRMVSNFALEAKKRQTVVMEKFAN